MKRILPLVLLFIALGAWYWRQFLRPTALPPTPRTVTQVLRALGPKIDDRLVPFFQAADVSYPPAQLTFIAFKAEKRLDVYASDAPTDGTTPSPPRFIFSRPILGASGTAGPKIREGDLQVPEGFYRIELLNPNSRFHLSLRVNYPNENDIHRGQAEGRSVETLGGDIMIHGGTASTGCLAMGDPVIEELFVLTARTGLDNISLIIVPWDFRTGQTQILPPNAPPWTSARYDVLRKALREFPPQE